MTVEDFKHVMKGWVSTPRCYLHRFCSLQATFYLGCVHSCDVVFEDVLGLDSVLEDRFVKSLALSSALEGFGFYAVLGLKTLHFKNSALQLVFAKTLAVN